MQTTAEKIISHLESYQIKAKGNGSFRCNSPLRVGDDSYDFWLKVETDGEHGVYKDHKTDESGSLYELAQKLGIDLPQMETNLTTKRAYTGLADYARQHGVSEDVFRAAKWRESVERNRPCLIIPTQSGERIRFIDGEKPAFGNHKGYKTCWYGLKGAIPLAIKNSVFVLTNGEASVVVAQHFGIGAACMTNSGERSDMTQDQLSDLKDLLGNNPPLVLVAFDSDDRGRKAAPLMADYLNGNGLEAKAIDLGLFQSGDLADFCALYQDESLERLKACQALIPTLNSSTWDDLIAPLDYLDTLRAPKWLIEPYLEMGGITTLYGRSGAGKSFMALDFALKVGRSDKVIYVIGEALLTFRQRKDAWMKHHHCKKNNTLITLRPLKVLESSDLSEFIRAARKHSPSLIIIDTLARAMVGFDENSTRDMGLFMDACDLIRRETGAAVILVHHTSKAGEEERGSYALRGASDIMLKLSNLDDLLVLESNKQKSIEDPEPAYFKRIPVEVSIEGKLVSSLVLVPADKVAKSEGVSPLQKKILELLIQEESLTKREMAEMLGNHPINSIGKACWTLTNAGYLAKAGKSEYEITDSGRKMIPRFHDSNDSTIPKSDSIPLPMESWNRGITESLESEDQKWEDFAKSLDGELSYLTEEDEQQLKMTGFISQPNHYNYG